MRISNQAARDFMTQLLKKYLLSVRNSDVEIE